MGLNSCSNCGIIRILLLINLIMQVKSFIMLLKTSLHIHTSEDKKDGHMIGYDAYRLIDEAEKSGFDVLGFTPHQKFVFKPEFAEYAKKKGILLIPGVERSFGRVLNKHVIILNCDKSIEKVKNFKQLIKYKKEHPEIFVLAPHPTYNRLLSVGARNLEKYIGLFDAIEYSWLYSKRMNSNKRAEKIALAHNKPMVSTADVHVLKKLDTDYALIEADGFTAESVFRAIKEQRFENITAPKKFADIAAYLIATNIKYVVKYIEKKMLGLDERELAEEII
jgi:predicted metal-dependent phosphoesterase TrpH